MKNARFEWMIFLPYLNINFCLEAYRYHQFQENCSNKPEAVDSNSPGGPTEKPPQSGTNNKEKHTLFIQFLFCFDFHKNVTKILS